MAEQTALLVQKGAALAAAVGTVEWMHDDEPQVCTLCFVPFTFFDRRRHFRNCGTLVCGGLCGPKRKPPGSGSATPPQRTYMPCAVVKLKQRRLCALAL